MNGQAERMIGLVKQVLVPILENKSYSYGELNTVLAEVAIIVNSRPIGIKGRTENVQEELHPITPLHLMLGRGSVDPPQMVEVGADLPRRLTFLEQVKREFWNKFKQLVFQGLDRSYKWRREHRDMRVGDVVLLKQETTALGTYKLGQISKVFYSPSDDKVHKVLVQYKNANESVFRETERPIQKLVLVVPVEEQQPEDMQLF